jgi:thiol-disulfide isomerase/thioredoxin
VAAGDSNSRVRGALMVVMLVAGISLLLWAGVHNARDRRLEAQKMQEMQANKVELTPGSAAGGNDSGGDGTTPKLQGKLAPGFSLVDLDGKKVSLADFKGKPVLVNFWATWCAPCRLEMPWFEEFHQKYGGQGLVILGVAADEAGKKTIGDSAHKLGVTYPILLADDKVTEAYGGVDYLPESFYVGKDGKVMMQTAGMTDGQGGKDEIEANIKKLLAGD